MIDEAEICRAVRGASPEVQRAFATELKKIWRQRQADAGELSPLARAFGTCDVKLVRFYEIGDFRRALIAVVGKD